MATSSAPEAIEGALPTRTVASCASAAAGSQESAIHDNTARVIVVIGSAPSTAQWGCGWPLPGGGDCPPGGANDWLLNGGEIGCWITMKACCVTWWQALQAAVSWSKAIVNLTRSRASIARASSAISRSLSAPMTGATVTSCTVG